MSDNRCPYCGHERSPKPRLMEQRSDWSIQEMWRGDGEPWQEALLKLAVFMFIFIFLTFAVIPNL